MYEILSCFLAQNKHSMEGIAIIILITDEKEEE